VLFEGELYAATSGGLLTRIRLGADPVESVRLIGHNPSLQQLALVGASAGDELGPLETKFPTGALATIVLMKKLG
jgi:phosphohistidine phosphatase